MQPLFTLWWNTNQDNSVFLLFLSRFMDFCTWIMSEIIHCLSVCGFTIFCTHIKKLSCCSLWIKAAGVKKQAKDIHRLQWDQRYELDCRCGGLNMSPNTFKKCFWGQRWSSLIVSPVFHFYLFRSWAATWQQRSPDCARLPNRTLCRSVRGWTCTRWRWVRLLHGHREDFSHSFISSIQSY